jgi:mannose-6-phosphate isomerase-like protein (cupin superfamily)
LNKIEYKKAYCEDCPNWQELLENFNDSYKKEEITTIKQNGFFVSHSAWKIKKVMNVLQKLKLNTAHLYINITQQAGSFGRHYDKSDVSFWQVQGQSLWLFDDGMRHILNCGDLIQVPANVYHTVLPLGPRAGISMSKTKGEING